MSHSYTPGLKVLHYLKIKKNRRLPLKGEIKKKVGDTVEANDIVAKTDLPGNVHMVKVANILNIAPNDIKDVLLAKDGDQIEKGDKIAETDGIFGYFKSELLSPVSGKIESISNITGQIVVREKPIPVEIDAYINGEVSDLIEEEGVTIESEVAYIQGIFGIGGEKRGNIEIIVNNRGEEIKEEMINQSHAGKIVVGGSFIGINAFKKAIDVKVAGIVVGGFNYFDLEDILGYKLGVAITGSENLNTSLVVTEGYGNIKMSERTFNLLNQHTNKFVSINGATQIRAGVIRPEIIIPLKQDEISKEMDSTNQQRGITIGSTVRVIRAPYFGKIGVVNDLPSELQKMESETLVRVASVKFDNEAYIIPRSNLEMLEIDTIK